MTVVLQLIVFVAAIAGLVGFGVYRDKKEDAPVIRGSISQRTSTK